MNPSSQDHEELFESTWSDRVANDPKHKPQFYDRLSTTVRKEWCRRPQEAHIADGEKYRRLSVEEIATIQGFNPDWVAVDSLSENEKIAVLGNAVAPPVAQAIGKTIEQSGYIKTKTSIEICAGIGGLGLGFTYLQPIAKIEMWDVACHVLRAHFKPEVVIHGKAQEFDFGSQKGKVGLLFGGPPCQPWSQAGAKRGNNDPRDVMGFTPEAVALCEPEVFLFENVPGLLSSVEHSDYREDLWRRLRNPKPGLSYGLDFKIINSADYGVPQIRRRVFIIGIKNQPDAKARRLLSDVLSAATHHDPEKPAYQKQPWVNLRTALSEVPNSNPWRKWNVSASEGSEQIVDAEGDTESLTTSVLKKDNGGDASTWLDRSRIGFWWPKKDQSLVFNDERWKFFPRESKRNVRAIMIDETIQYSDGPTHLAIKGDYTDTINALSPILKGCTNLIYWDLPRLDSDGEFSQRTEPGHSRSAWMSLLRDVSSSAHKILRQQGYFAVQTDEESAHYARMILDETFGHSNHLTTFAWEKKYSPQNDRPTPTDSFDYIIVYSNSPRESITEKIGLVVKADKIIDDGDFRGCYTAGHKGARSGSEKTKFKVNVPPYHWNLDSCSLPINDGYFFDKITGVLHIKNVRESGDFYLNVTCEDSKGKQSSRRINFVIRDKKNRQDSWLEPTSVEWLIKDKKSSHVSGGEITIDPDISTEGVVGSNYSLILKATGGTPFVGKSDQPGSGRFWEFGQSTLVSLVVKAAASFGVSGTALPSEKKFMSRSETTKRISVRNWLPWDAVGKSEDATRHLQTLAKIGYGNTIAKSFAKPEALCYYLIQLFAPNSGDTVLDIGDGYASMSSAAIKTGRRAVHLIGPSRSDEELWMNTAEWRLKAVMDGADKNGISAQTDEAGEEFIQSEPGSISFAHLSSSAVIKSNESDISFKLDPSENYEIFVAALRGYLPDKKSPTGFSDLYKNNCLVISPDDILDEIRLSDCSKYASVDRNLTVLYERSDINDDLDAFQNIKLVRVPFEVN